MVRNAEIRKRRYEKSLHPERIGAKFEGLKPVMVEQESRYLAQISHVEAKVKQVCEAAGVSSFEVAQYINFGRQVWTLADRFTGDTLAAEVQWLVNHWGSRGLDGALLLVIAGFWGVTPSPPVPPQHGNERHTPDFLPVDGTLPMTGPLRIEAPANADALIVGSPTLEGGNISVYGPAAVRTLWFDADEAYLELQGLSEDLPAVMFLYQDADRQRYIGMMANPVRLYLSDCVEDAVVDLYAQFDGPALRLGSPSMEGGDIYVYRDTLGNTQLFLDADALENATALTLFGRQRVGVTNPVELRGDTGEVIGGGYTLGPEAVNVCKLGCAYQSIIAGTWIPIIIVAWPGLLNSPPALNDEVQYRFAAKAGTFTFVLHSDMDSNRGIVTVYIDGVSIGSIDMYSPGWATALYTLSATLTTTGVHTLNIRVTSTNPLSGNYYAFIVAWWFRD